MYKDAFLKVSGTVAEDKFRTEAFVSGLALLARDTARRVRFHVIPGGGHVVDRLRGEWDTKRRELTTTAPHLEKAIEPVDDEEYHWRAINAMDGNAKRLRAMLDGEPCITVPPIRDTLQDCAEQLPATWAITSDSIAYHLATMEGRAQETPLIILLKDVDGVHEVVSKARRGMAAGRFLRELHIHKGTIAPALPSYPFDQHLPVLASKRRVPFYIVHVEHLDRVGRLLKGDENVPCTRITVS